MATAEATIPVLLNDRLEDLVLSPALPISWPEVHFTPPGDGKYLEVRFLPNFVARDYVGSTDPHRHVGLYQVSVVHPRGAGIIKAVEVAGLVSAHFPADLALDSADPEFRLVVTSKPSVAAPLTEEKSLRVPVTIPWRAII